jgi:hypothetical protein
VRELLEEVRAEALPAALVTTTRRRPAGIGVAELRALLAAPEVADFAA